MADYSYSPGRSTMSTASSTRLGGNTISKAQSGIRPRGNIATRRSKYVTRSSTGISPAKGGAYSQMFSELIPNVNFNKITLTGGRGKSALKVKINFVLKDVVEKDGISEWFANSFDTDPTSSPIEKYLKINIIQCTHPDVCEVLSGRQSNSYLLDKGMSARDRLLHIKNRSINLDAKINTGGTDSKSIDEYRRFVAGGEEIIEIPLEETFQVFDYADGGGNDLQHLSYFVWISMDVGKMANDFDMDEAFFKQAAPDTSVYSEYVIQNGNVVSDTNIFLLPSGEIWEGETHYHDPAINPDPVNKSFKGYMTGRVHTPDSQYLQVKTVTNPKIRDFRFVDRVEDRYRSVTQARIGAGLVEGEAEVGEAIEEDIISESVAEYTKLLGKEVMPDKKSGVFTELWTSTDEAHNGNGMFAFDYAAFLKNNSAFPYLWSISEETTLKLLSYARIVEMRLIRRQVNPKEKLNNKLGTPDRPSGRRRPYRLLARTSERKNRNKTITTVSNSSCFLQETKVDLFGSEQKGGARTDGIRWFTFTDRGLFNERDGTYQYSVQIKSLDPTAAMMRRNLKKLYRVRRSLNRYLTEATGYTKNKPNFDIYVDRYIPEFISRMYVRGRKLFTEAPAMYLDVLREISNVLDQPAYPGSNYTLETVLPSTLSSYLDPYKGSPEGIQTVINMVDSMIREVQEKVGNLSMGATRQTRKNTSNAISPRVRSSRSVKFLEVEHVFGCGQEIVLDGYRGKGYDFITNQTLDFVRDNIKGSGLRTLTSRYYRKRCEIETKRYFTIASEQGGANENFDLREMLGSLEPDLSISSENSRDSLINKKFSFLTPSFVFQSFGGAVGGFSGGGSGPPPGGDYVGWQLDAPDSMTPGRSAGGGSRSAGGGSVTYNSLLPNINIQAVALNLMKPGRLANLTPNQTPKNEQQEAPAPLTGLDEVQANVIAAQANPDFSLFPISVKGYQPPGRSKLSAAEQAMKKQYMELLANSCQVVDAIQEFNLDRTLRTDSNANTFEIDDSNPSDESLNEPVGPDYENIDHAEDVGTKKLLPLKKIQPLMPKEIRNVNPTPLLKILGNMSFGYVPGGPRGPISYKSLHISNFQMLNFSDSSTPSILDGINPSNKISTLKALPNQLKSLVLASSNIVLTNVFLQPSRTVPSENAPPIDGTPWFFRPENMSKIWQMFQNIAGIEYLYTFETPHMQLNRAGSLVRVRGQRDLLKRPQWRELDRDVINRLEAGERKVALLCRIKKYKNSKLGIGYSNRKDLPIIDEYFTLVIDPFADPDLGRIQAVDDGDLEGEVKFQMSTGSGTGGNSNLVANDSGGINAFLDDKLFKLRIVDGDTVTVKEFDGNLVVSSNCDEGGT